MKVVANTMVVFILQFINESDKYVDALNWYNVMCQLYLNKAEGKRK